MSPQLYYIDTPPLKRFLVFSYDSYDGGGGLEALAGDFDDLNEALECFESEARYGHRVIFDRIAGLEINATKYGLKY